MTQLLRSSRLLVPALAAALCSPLAWAQATVKPDGVWRAALGVGASFASGNSKSQNFSLIGDAVNVTAQDKTAVYGTILRAKSGSATTADAQRLGGRYEWNLGPSLFAFGSLDLERDKPANLKRRSVLGTGLGWKVIKSAPLNFDVFGGVGYTSDGYFAATRIDGATRSSYSYATLMLGEESTHRLSDTTAFKQRLVLFPNLKNSGEYRATWDAGLAVAMSKTLNLTVGAAWRYNSEPGVGRKSTDTLLTTGIAVKFD
jgi:putative salt-induced outer membrane protein